MPIQGAFVGQDEKTQQKVRKQSRAIQAQRLADAQAGKMALAQTEQAGAMARTNTTGQFDLARQKLAGENALATTGLHVAGQKDITGMQGTNQLAVQKLAGENALATTGLHVAGQKDITGMQGTNQLAVQKLAGENTLANTGLQNQGNLERTQLTEAGTTQRGREGFAQSALLAGVPGSLVQGIYNTPTWGTPDVSGVTVPQKQQHGLYAATKDGEGKTTIYNTVTGATAGEPAARTSGMPGATGARPDLSSFNNGTTTNGRGATGTWGDTPVSVPARTSGMPGATGARPDLSSFNNGTTTNGRGATGTWGDTPVSVPATTPTSTQPLENRAAHTIAGVRPTFNSEVPSWKANPGAAYNPSLNMATAAAHTLSGSPTWGGETGASPVPSWKVNQSLQEVEPVSTLQPQKKPRKRLADFSTVSAH